ncbi:hypothetical protein ILYODFUR_005377 [Ilyodon furcidens]|uniref:Uncharacterized protein n=1 Tax=Ilyodon furcidens TaxID=33524 RepID=A0ABV0U759_9TELE
MVTLEELWRSTTQVGESVNSETISHAPHKSDICGRVAKTNLSELKPQVMRGTWRTCRAANVHNAMFGGKQMLPVKNPEYTISAVNMVVAASWCGNKITGK